MYGRVYVIIRRPLSELERVSLHPPTPSNPADPNQPLMQYRGATAHPANRNLPIPQSAGCLIASS